MQLTSSDFKRAIENSLRFKKLVMDAPVGTLRHTNESDGQRFSVNPPYFLFAFESQIKAERILEIIVEGYPAAAKGGTKCLDAVFLLDDHTWLVNYGDGQGKFFYRNDKGEYAKGWHIHSNENVMFLFQAWLSAVIPRMVMFSSIMPKYFF